MGADEPQVRSDRALRETLQRWLEGDQGSRTRLEELRTVAEVVVVAGQVLEQRVLEARSFRHSWAEIAAALGVTKQSAHRRWRHLDPAADALAAERERRFRPTRLPIGPVVDPEDWDRWRPGQ